MFANRPARLLIALMLLVHGPLTIGQHHAHDEHALPAAAESTLPGLELSDGERWQMDTHTRQTFSEMETGFTGVDFDTAPTDTLRAIGAKLEDDIRTLIRGCTMQGAAHDQLHQYLVAFMPAVDELAASGSRADAVRVAEMIELFPRYFE